MLGSSTRKSGERTESVQLLESASRDRTMTTVLWIADTELLALDHQLEQMMLLLNAAEREKTLRFRKREDRLRCAVGRLLIRALASERLGRANVSVLVSEYGKPFFAQENAVHFSLSHSGKLVVLAFGELPLGVDVEECRPLVWRELACVFGAEERALLETDKDPLRLFYRLWTVREAFSKEEGLGLPIFENGSMVLDYSSETIRYQSRTLCFRTWELPEYTLSVCAEQLGEIILCRLSSEDWKRILICNGGSDLPKEEE